MGDITALITPWQRRALRATKLDRRTKHKIQHRISKTLDTLASDIRAIFDSPHLAQFNWLNDCEWIVLEGIIKKGRESLQPIFKAVDYDVLELTNKDGLDCCYVLAKDRLLFQRPRMKEARHRYTTFRLFIDESEKDFRRYFDRPKTLAINLSLRRIKKRHARRVLKDAIGRGYKFPVKKEDAVPIRKIAKEI